MRKPLLCLGALALACGLGVAGAAQTGLRDPVQGLPYALQSPDLRTAALAYLDSVRQDFGLRRNGMPGFSLRASFQASGELPYTGSGSLQEDWINAGSWQWSATLGAARLDRYNGVRTTDPAAPMPLRVKMVREALFRVGEVPGAEKGSIRSAKATWRGTAALCYLFTVAGAPLPAMGRADREQEYCFANDSGLLLVWSPVPGVYFSYDYGGGPVYQGHRLPGAVRVSEGGQTVLEIRVEGVTRLDAIAPPASALLRGSSMQNAQVRWIEWALPPGQADASPRRVLMHVSTDAQAADPDLAKIVQAQLPSLARAGPISNVPNVGVQHELYLGVVFSPSASAPPPLPPVTAAPGAPSGRWPYEGTRVTDTVRTLTDGNVIETSRSMRQARDSQGRTYRELIGPVQRERTYSISDPTTGSTIEVYPGRQFAIERSPLAGAGGATINGVHLPPLPSSPPPPLPTRPVITTEPLGAQQVDGVAATGRRYTDVYPAGSVGNREPITVVRETWRSDDLGLVVKQITNDPRTGVSTSEFHDLQVGEPPAELFTIPAGYTVVDQNGKPIRPTVAASGSGSGSRP